MGAKPLGFVDQAFLLFETEASPKHVGGLFVFKIPEGSPRNYVKKIFKELREHTTTIPPFNLLLSMSPRYGFCWKELDDIDIDEHLQYHKLPARSSHNDLLDFVGELHSPVLDRSKPMWEAHIIDGLKDGIFALYTKIHHAYGDGMSFTRLFGEGLEKKPNKNITKIFWDAGYAFEYGSPPSKSFGEQLRNTLTMLGAPTRALIGLNRISLLLWLERFGFTKNSIAIPFTAARSPLTGQVTQGRQLACAAVSMERVAMLRKMTRSTLNHIALTCIDGALRTYLQEIGGKFDRPIAIQMPVNLRTAKDKPGGNKIGIVLVELAPETQDPYVRLREIGIALRNVRHQVDTLSTTSIVAYGVLINTVAQIAETLGISNWLPPLGNTLVSNVPGPKHALFLAESELTEYYPISALPPGLHLNITLFSYDGKLNFGLIATKDELPDLHRLGEHIEAAFTELEVAIRTEAPPKARPNEKKPTRKPRPAKKAKKRVRTRVAQRN